MRKATLGIGALVLAVIAVACAAPRLLAEPGLWLIAAYHLLRRSVADQHTTAWLAAQTIATSLAFLAAGVYVVFTYLMWRQNHRATQVVLMQQLMAEYDGLRQRIETIQEWYRESASAGVDAVTRFGEAAGLDFVPDDVRVVDDARFDVSRFFVKIRKLCLAGFLERRIVILALGRAAMEDVFLELIDPLDRVKASGKYGKSDRDFFDELVRDRKKPARQRRFWWSKWSPH